VIQSGVVELGPGDQMIRRRELLGGIAASGLATSNPARAQPKGRPARIAYLAERGGPNEFEQAFLRGLRERGWVDGEQVQIDFRWAGGDAQRLKTNVIEALAASPALAVVTDRASARAVQALDPGMAIVHPVMGDAIAAGYSGSLSRPDRNLTGVSALATELAGKRVELLKEAVPGLQRVGVLFNAVRPLEYGAGTRAAAQTLGLTPIDMLLAMPDGIDSGFAAAARQGVQAVVVVSDTSTITHRAPLCEAALKHRIPAIFANRTYLRAGGLMSYGPDLEGAFHRAAYYVDRILKGARPADLPIEQPTTILLVLNQRTAAAMGLRFPQPLLVRADEVIQ
jgi:putative ABC transport system substrate-binding protein